MIYVLVDETWLWTKTQDKDIVFQMQYSRISYAMELMQIKALHSMSQVKQEFPSAELNPSYNTLLNKRPVRNYRRHASGKHLC